MTQTFHQVAVETDGYISDPIMLSRPVQVDFDGEESATFRYSIVIRYTDPADDSNTDVFIKDYNQGDELAIQGIDNDDVDIIVEAAKGIVTGKQIGRAHV